MIVEGLGLMIAGMGVVFAFLTLLVAAMKVSAKVLERFADADVTVEPLVKPTTATTAKAKAKDNMAEIAVAIAAAKACARS